MKVGGLVALITGGANGLGKGFAAALLQKGARNQVFQKWRSLNPLHFSLSYAGASKNAGNLAVVTPTEGVSLVDIDDGKSVTDELSPKYGSERILYHQADVTSDSDMEGAFKKTVDHFKRLDVVCNNAGIADEKNWQKVIDVDLTAVIRGTKLAKKYMDKREGGSGGVVINVSSLAGVLFVPFQPVYAAAKHGVIGYSKSIASPGGDPAFARDNIRVNMVCPTFCDTDIIRKSVPDKSPEDFEEFKASLDFVQLSDVVAAYMKLVEEDHHGEAIRITTQNGIDFHKFRKQESYSPSSRI